MQVAGAYEMDFNWMRTFSRLLDEQLRNGFETRNQTLHAHSKRRTVAFLRAIDHCS
jgi:hypothetical protein